MVPHVKHGVFGRGIDGIKKGWIMEPSVLEELASIEHDQWMVWAQTILVTENISPEREARWKQYFVPYEELPEEVKEFDREWAWKVIDYLRDHGVDVLP